MSITCPMEQVNIIFYYIFQLSPSAASNTYGNFIKLEKGAPLDRQIRKGCCLLQAATVPHWGEMFGQWNVGLGYKAPWSNIKTT